MSLCGGRGGGEEGGGEREKEEKVWQNQKFIKGTNCYIKIPNPSNIMKNNNPKYNMLFQLFVPSLVYAHEPRLKPQILQTLTL